MNSLYELIEKYVVEYLPKERGYSVNTSLSYYTSLSQYLHFCGYNTERNISILDFTPEKVTAFLDHIEDEGCAITTRNQRLAAIKSFLNYSALCEPLYQNTYQGIDRIPMKKEPKQKMDYLTVREYEALLKSIDINNDTGFRHFVIINVMYETAARAQELADLKVDDLDFDDNSIRIFGKGKKYRIVYISERCSKLIYEYMRRFEISSGVLLRNRQGNKLTRFGLEYIVKKYCEAAKAIEPSMKNKIITPHSVRRSKACHFLENGTALPIIQKFLGHGSVQTTEIYLDVSPSSIMNAVEKASARISVDKGEEKIAKWKNRDVINKIKAAFE